MRTWPKFLTFLLQCVLLGLAAAYVVTLVDPRFRPRTEVPSAAPARSYSAAVGRASPAVVNIYANRIVTEQAYRVSPNPALQQFFGSTPVGPPRRRLQQNLGSGVIVSSDGTLLTNHHVIAGADDIKAQLSDGRVAPATVVGSDPDTDLAVLKLDLGELPSAQFAKAGSLQVGDVVLAIGNPVDVGRTVTLGIVSATGREFASLSVYADFIQTDAAINEGNSGGALVNAEGDLVGINTAMLSRNTGAQGISFAIPAETARSIMGEILRQGHVTRGWIGAEFTDVQVVDSASGQPSRAVQLSAVYEQSPALAAGLQAGDVIVGFNQHDVFETGQLRKLEADSKPGTNIRLSGYRGGVPFTLELALAQRPRVSG